MDGVSGGYYLLDKPKVGPRKWYATRKKPIQGVVVHITAGLEQLGPGDDHSAERTAEYARTTDRQVSWHSGADTDTAIRLLPPTYTAFHCAGYNSSTLGLELSKRHTDWFGMSPEWVRKTLANGAKAVADWWPILYAEGVPLAKVTKAEWDDGEKGFISHAELDPGRRSDPGWVKGKDTFPWQQFFDAIAAAITPPSPTPEDDDMQFRAIRRVPDGAIALVAPRYFKHVNGDELAAAIAAGLTQQPADEVNEVEWDRVKALVLAT